MDPETTLDPQFSTPDATPTAWSTARDQLRAAMSYLLTTVRPDGRPHQTTIAGIWLVEGFHFCTGRAERKARNLEAGNRNVIVTASARRAGGSDQPANEGPSFGATVPDATTTRCERARVAPT